MSSFSAYLAYGSGVQVPTAPSTPRYGRGAGMTPETDPRLDKTYAAKFLAFGMGGISPPLPMGSTYEETKEKVIPGVAEGYKQFFDAMVQDVPVYDVKKREVLIDGVDGNKIPLTIYQGTSKTCYYHIHGGGMAIMSSREQPYPRQLNHLCGKHGMTVVTVDYRTYLHHLDKNIKVAQFPAGLNDCYSGLEWVYAHKEELGCDKIVNFGESGGGNLVLTLALKTLKEGRPELLDGSFAMCPEVSGDVYDERFPSMRECNGYFINLTCEEGRRFVNYYTADPKDRKNPLAWPVEAKPADMKGMKPVMILVNELDPFRDAGLEVYRNLLAGGVRAEARIVAGTLHAADNIGYGPYYIFETSANAIKSFAAGLRGTILVEAPAPTPKVTEAVPPAVPEGGTDE